jgi:hypothetical protein
VEKKKIDKRLESWILYSDPIYMFLNDQWYCNVLSDHQKQVC